MGYIKAYFVNIIAVILFTVLVEILMPNSSFKSYIKLVLGLIVVLAVIKPITSINIFDTYTISIDESYAVSTSEIEEVQITQLDRVFCEKIQNHIADDVYGKFNTYISVFVDGDTTEIRKIIINDVKQDIADDIISYISEKYGVTNVILGGE